MSRKRVGFPFVIITGVMVIFAAAQPLGQDPIGPIRAVTPQAVSPDGEVIEGTWIADQRDTTGRLVAQGLVTFSRGGGVVENHNPARPSLRSAWHGTWVRRGFHDFLVTEVRWNFDSEGNFNGISKGYLTLRVNATLDGYSGDFTNERFDLSGNRVNRVQRRLQAVRLAAEPFQ